eukprot:TRINITY_DN45773_c0_g1_i1.p1 TRINITY_DN45773_c0_g1~~TRINITY_DN45773_c0_g1_i1.p1  ORF type:complete len:344 (+),score=30.30 TRINITY_DN45773_c0_g1_i1:80-1033(+)
MDTLIAGKYRLKSSIVSSPFGGVYTGFNVETNEDVAIKLEAVTSSRLRLLGEAATYRTLAGIRGVPTVHWYGTHSEYNIVVLDLLGPSLQELFESNGRRFSLKTVLMLADQMISCVESVHNKGIIHRSIKPGHFVTGLRMEVNEVYLLDFGLAKSYVDPKLKTHVSLAEDTHPQGPPPFVSVGGHHGLRLSRRDDLESVGYVLMYFLRGDLPWEGTQVSCTRTNSKPMLRQKVSTPIDQLCRQAPRELAEFFTYSGSLLFEDTPDYDLLRRSLREAFYRLGHNYDFVFDWTLRASNHQQSRQMNGVLAESEDVSRDP